MVTWQSTPALGGRGTPPLLFGTVALWGRVLEHEAGYRAEYAYPVELIYTEGECDADQIIRAYGCRRADPGDFAQWFRAARAEWTAWWNTAGQRACDPTLFTQSAAPYGYAAALAAATHEYELRQYERQQEQQLAKEERARQAELAGARNAARGKRIFDLD